MSLISNQSLDFYLPNDKVNKEKICVALITDVVDWAFANIAFNLMNHYQNTIDFTIIPINDPLSFNGNRLHVLLAAQDCDVLHFMWKGALFWLNSDLYASIQNICTLETLNSKFLNNKIISTCIYDHTLLPNEESLVYEFFQSKITNYYVSNNRLFTIYSNIEGINKPKSVCTDGVDIKLFKPINPYKYDLSNLVGRKIKVGWAGNSKWGESIDDHKGLHSIIKPTVARLVNEGYPLEIEIADRNIIWREQEEMPDFYNSIDIYVCASLHEGTPNTVLEAMACGALIITTDVGVVRDALGPNQQEYIVDRTLNDFYDKMKHLLDNLPLWKHLSFENIKYIQPWSWSIKAQELVDYFTLIAKEKTLLEPAH